MDEKNTNIPENEEVSQAEITEATEVSTNPGLRFLKEIIDWLETFALAFAFVIVVFTFMFKIVTVEGRSMHYTLNENDKLIITDMFYTPKQGDIVVIQEPHRYEQPIIKRVIATEGQKVKIDYDKWAVYVDGVLLDEPYVNYDDRNEGLPMYNFGCVEEFTVAENNVFVMGDNRNNSADSRGKTYTLQDDGSYIYTGYTEEEILGHVIVRLLPFDKIGKISPATEKQIEEIKSKYIY